MTILISTTIAFLLAIGVYSYYNDYVAKSPPAQQSSQTEVTTNAPGGVPALASLNRSGQNLSKMPDDILAMTNLQDLNLSNNQLTGALPAEIRRLQNLQILDISNNKMTGLPAELGQLSKLRILKASNNQLTGIPHELGSLQKLEVLDLSGNDISDEDLRIIRDRLPSTTQILL